MNAQEIFDTVAKHLAQQGHRAFDGMCKYRAPGGDKCAVGILIEDSEYSAKWDAAGDLDFVQADGLLPRRLAQHFGLLKTLQRAHDVTQHRVDRFLEPDPRPMRERLDAIAIAHDLSPAILDTLTFPEVWA